MFNANNYGYYNPTRFTQPLYQQPINDNVQSINYKLNGKQVESIEVVKAMDIPLDGSISYYPITDGSAIVTKQLQNDGTSKTIVYKPIKEEEIKTEYVTKDILDKELDKIDLSDIEEELKELKKEIKELKKKAKDE